MMIVPPIGNQQQSFPADRISWLINQSLLMWQNAKLRTKEIMIELHVPDLLDKAGVYLAQHPIMALIAITITISCGIPILMFVVFAAFTVFLTFTGFIVIEGTLLTIGSVVLIGVVLAMVLVMITIAFAVGVAYLGFVEMYGLLHNSPENSPVARFLPNKVNIITDSK